MKNNTCMFCNLSKTLPNAKFSIYQQFQQILKKNEFKFANCVTLVEMGLKKQKLKGLKTYAILPWNVISSNCFLQVVAHSNTNLIAPPFSVHYQCSISPLIIFTMSGFIQFFNFSVYIPYDFPPCNPYNVLVLFRHGPGLAGILHKQS